MFLVDHGLLKPVTFLTWDRVIVMLIWISILSFWRCIPSDARFSVDDVSFTFWEDLDTSFLCICPRIDWATSYSGPQCLMTVSCVPITVRRVSPRQPPSLGKHKIWQINLCEHSTLNDSLNSSH